ncbi:MAG: tetratricopeptide repeat protein, partial [Gemmatimonadota bacterium]|nr:tetratricopeptide repeat protein [Gemmatimonadota bacterium]
MTHPLSDGEATATQPRAESFVDWFHINSRLISVGAIVVVAIGFGMWFVQRTALNETISADKQLLTAKASLNSRNLPLAESDLKKVADKYPKRPAGVEAGLLLGQLRLEKGDYQGAASELEGLSSKVSSGPGASAIRGLLGDAKAQLSKPADAAVEYEKAATLAEGPGEKSFWRAKAARAYV